MMDLSNAVNQTTPKLRAQTMLQSQIAYENRVCAEGALEVYDACTEAAFQATSKKLNPVELQALHAEGVEKACDYFERHVKTIDDIVHGELLQKLEKRKQKLEYINDNLNLWLQFVEENPGKVALIVGGAAAGFGIFGGAVAVAAIKYPKATVEIIKVLVRAVIGH